MICGGSVHFLVENFCVCGIFFSTRASVLCHRPVQKIIPVTCTMQHQMKAPQTRPNALEEAKKNRTGLVMWTDGSKLDHGRVGAAVCWKESPIDLWKEKSVFLGKNKEVLDAELWAISNALDIAAKKTSNDKGVPITIFCDSQKALRAIENSPYHKETRFLRSLIYEKS